MGIRGYFEKYPETERDLKFSDLNLEEREESKELKFDAEKEISDKDWEMMLNDLDRERSHSRYNIFCFLAMKYKLLFPDRTEQLSLDDDKSRGYVENKLIGSLEDGKVVRFVSDMARAKCVFPDIFEKIKIDQEKMDRIREEFDHFFERAPYHRRHLAPMWFAELKILFPRLFRELDKKVVSELKKISLESIERERGVDWRWGDFATEAAFFRVLFPEEFGQIKVDEKAWRGMHRILRREWRSGWQSKESLDSFSTIAWAMKILAAEEVKVTDQGLELVMRKEDIKIRKKERPVRKRF